HAWREVQPTRPPTDGERPPQVPGLDLSADDWRLLASAPHTIGTVLMGLVDSGMIGTLSEEGAIALGPAQAARRYPGNLLIQAVLGQMQAQERRVREQ